MFWGIPKYDAESRSKQGCGDVVTSIVTSLHQGGAPSRVGTMKPDNFSGWVGSWEILKRAHYEHHCRGSGHEHLAYLLPNEFNEGGIDSNNRYVRKPYGQVDGIHW